MKSIFSPIPDAFRAEVEADCSLPAVVDLLSVVVLRPDLSATQWFGSPAVVNSAWRREVKPVGLQPVTSPSVQTHEAAGLCVSEAVLRVPLCAQVDSYMRAEAARHRDWINARKWTRVVDFGGPILPLGTRVDEEFGPVREITVGDWFVGEDVMLPDPWRTVRRAIEGADMKFRHMLTFLRLALAFNGRDWVAELGDMTREQIIIKLQGAA